MRLSRNRNWGNPRLLDYLERLASDAHALDGWPGLLVGDMSQPRGGPMLNGHTSHQVGLDADIWLTPMPDRILTAAGARGHERGVDAQGSRSASIPQIFTLLSVKLIKRAAILPASRAHLRASGHQEGAVPAGAASRARTRAWLGKVRPWWNHHYHFHVRLACPPGADGCENQKPAAGDNGCGQELTNWYAMLKTVGDRDRKGARPGAKPGWASRRSPWRNCRRNAARCSRPAASSRRSRTRPAPRRPTPAALAALATKDAGPPVPVLTPAQLKALTGAGRRHAAARPQSASVEASREPRYRAVSPPCRSDEQSLYRRATQRLWRAVEKLLRPAADRFLPHRLLSYRA